MLPFKFNSLESTTFVTITNNERRNSNVEISSKVLRHRVVTKFIDNIALDVLIIQQSFEETSPHIPARSLNANGKEILRQSYPLAYPALYPKKKEIIVSKMEGGRLMLTHIRCCRWVSRLNYGSSHRDVKSRLSSARFGFQKGHPPEIGTYLGVKDRPEISFLVPP